MKPKYKYIIYALTGLWIIFLMISNALFKESELVAIKQYTNSLVRENILREMLKEKETELERAVNIIGSIKIDSEEFERVIEYMKGK